MKTYYFSYGINCNPALLTEKGVTVFSKQRALLEDFRLVFNKKALRDELPTSVGFANIQPSPSSNVEGLLYEIAEDSLSALDVAQKSPEHYERKQLSVTTESGAENAWVYVAKASMTSDGLVPSRNYLNHLMKAESFLSQQYLDALRRIDVHKDHCFCCERFGEVLFTREDQKLQVVCQACLEAQSKWGQVIHRKLTLAETAAVMQKLVMKGEGFSSLENLMSAAVEQGIVNSAIS